jgi:hypothetical protein
MTRTIRISDADRSDTVRYVLKNEANDNIYIYLNQQNTVRSSSQQAQYSFKLSEVVQESPRPRQRVSHTDLKRSMTQTTLSTHRKDQTRLVMLQCLS